MGDRRGKDDGSFFRYLSRRGRLGRRCIMMLRRDKACFADVDFFILLCISDT